MRDMLFISHANPEDNDLARWLALRLANEGYPVWCDVTKLLGGENFWSDIEDAIRTRTVKLVFIASSASNSKPGCKKELALAEVVQRKEGLKDFIIPLWADPTLRPVDFNNYLTQLNAIEFFRWDRGLFSLLEKLSDAGVAKKTSFGPGSVRDWWQANAHGANTVQSSPEPVLSNLFPLHNAKLFFHKIEFAAAAPPDEVEPEFPVVEHKGHLISFATASELRGYAARFGEIADTKEWDLGDSSTRPNHFWSYADERYALSRLLNEGWRRLLGVKSLPSYDFAARSTAFYFVKGQVKSDMVYFTFQNGAKGNRQVVGSSGIKRGELTLTRYWHLAITARPVTSPSIGLVLTPHVLFSDDGRLIWEDKDRIHRVRRSLCKNWWNDKWRDLNMAAATYLSDGNHIRLPLSDESAVSVTRFPVEFTSAASFDETKLDAPIADEDWEDVDIGDLVGEGDE